MIFNEYEYAKELIKDEDEINLYQPETNIIARYLREENLSNDGIKEVLEEILKHRCKYSDATVSEYVKKAIEDLNIHKLRPNDDIVIWQKEIDKILELESLSLQRIMFSIMYIAKYMKYNSNIRDPQASKYENLYYKIPLNNAWRMSKVQVKAEEKNELLHKLYTLGFIEATFSGGIKILIEHKGDIETEKYYLLKPNADVVLFISSFSDDGCLGCVRCGAWFKKNKSAKTIKYCKRCSEKSKKEKTLERVKKYNQKNN